MKLILTIIFALSLTITAATSYSATGINEGRIKTLWWYEGHTGVLIYQEGITDLGGCGRSDFFILDSGHAFFKEIYSLILTAHVSNEPLFLHIDGCFEGVSRIKHVESRR